MLREPLRERARNQWPAILQALGVPAKVLRNRHGPCPVCGGRDRFRFDDKGGAGTWICNRCGAGDGIELVKRLHKLEFKDAAQMIEQHVGDAPLSPTMQSIRRSNDTAKRQEMRALWERAQPITPEDAAGRYLYARTCLTAFPNTLRFAADERYLEQGTRPSWHPMLVAKIEPSDEAQAKGERCALHRTYLDQNGGKAHVASARKMMGAMPVGAAVRLMQHQDVLGIAEGIETAISASVLFNIPVWAALTAGLLETWIPPACVRTVFVFGDNDESYAGQAAAYTLAQRLRAKNLTTLVELPQRTGADWNDVLRARLQR